jgi:tetratricopeptide (TPR) repeat protein
VVAYPGDAPLLVNLGVARLAVGEAAEAVRVLQQAVRVAPALPAAHKALGDALYLGRQFDEALRAYQVVVALAPHHGADVHGRIGDIHFRRGEVAEARAAWARALAINPAHRLAPATGQEVAA